MRALMLAAGMGRRMFGDENQALPKSLLKFGGKTLIERHIEVLSSYGITSLTLVVGHRHEELLAEANRVAPAGFIHSVYNPRYREGPKYSMAKGADVLCSGEDVLMMDADVLYHPDLLKPLIQSNDPACFIFDREFQSTDDFVKVCLDGGRVVDFGKIVGEGYETVGEWPGFMKMSPAIGAQVVKANAGLIARGQDEGAYEDGICEVLKASPDGTFAHAEITGIPWVEIDYEPDLQKAEQKILPRLSETLSR